MAIIVEDGSIVAGANSYVSELTLTEYAAARGITITGATEALLINAMDYIESQMFIGVKKTAAQNLQWPRSNVYVDGYYVEPTILPAELRSAQIAVALAIDAGNGPLAVMTPGIKKEKVDVIEIEYQDGGLTSNLDPKINAILKKLLVGGGGVSTFNVVRA